MRIALMLSVLFSSVVLVAFAATAQIDLGGQSTPQELADIKGLAEVRREIIAGPYNIDWREVEVVRIDLDLDGDGRKEAIVRFAGFHVCGASSCWTLVVKWINNKAKVVGVIDDSQLWVLKSSTKGWRDLRGHYHDYKWNGKAYDLFCASDRPCNKG